MSSAAHGTGRRPSEEDREETRKERINRELIELLNELRVALPGVQFLFAFLLIVPFQQTAKDLTPYFWPSDEDMARARHQHAALGGGRKDGMLPRARCRHFGRMDRPFVRQTVSA